MKNIRTVRTNILRKANTSILSFDKCVEATSDTQKPNKNNICTNNDSVTCAGDLSDGE